MRRSLRVSVIISPLYGWRTVRILKRPFLGLLKRIDPLYARKRPSAQDGLHLLIQTVPTPYAEVWFHDLHVK